MTATTFDPTVSDAANAYLTKCWYWQPYGASATDAAYLRWEAAWDRLCLDAEHGEPAALEALNLIDAEVDQTISRRREEVARGA